MMLIKRVGTLSALLFSAVLLVACEGMSSSDSTDATDTTTGGDTGGGGTTTTTPTPTYYLGSGTGTSFVPGQLELGVTTLSAGGQTSVTATLADSNGTLYTTPVNVEFSSVCSGKGLASLESPITSSGGTAVTTYQATGCEGTDTITATATVEGTARTATADITVQSAVVGSLAFVSADPAQIGLKNTGLISSSKVTFQIRDLNGNPVPNKQVDFVLSNTTGGTALSDDFATSDANGYVTTSVNAGTVPETVKVTASYSENPAIKTQSDGLVISTGIADNDSFSLSAEVLNPEAWAYDGVKVAITAYAADHYNNPVPDGSSVLFHTEGGLIGSSCTTVGGGCSVDWISTNPRPADGRVTITATMIGEESFTDLNGNGFFEDGEPYEDLAEAFRDYNENGARDANEEFYDFNNDLSYSPADGYYNGVLCSDPLVCDLDNPAVHVRRNIVLVMSGSGAYVTFRDGTGLEISSINLAAGSFSGSIEIKDLRGQVMPMDTTVSVKTSNGKLLSASSYKVPNTNYNGSLSIPLMLEGDTTPSYGMVTVDVTTPKKVLSTGSISVND